MYAHFEDRYCSLNAEQKKAVDTIYGPILVMAGPGSGKTELLAIRIANILRETDTNPSNILCLTFTDNAAQNMRDRLRQIIGADAYRVAIHTFHTFGLEIINRFRHYMSEYHEATPIDIIESSRIFRDIIEGLPWDHPWKKQSRIDNVTNAIRLLKEAGITPEDFSQILQKNEQILNHIGPIITEHCTHIFSLGQKKTEKMEKIARFETLKNILIRELESFGAYHGLHETLASSIQRSLEEVTQNISHDADSKPITAWKNTWLELTPSGFNLKEFSRLKESRGILDIYQSYQHALSEKNLIDFADMILEAIRLIESNDSIASTLAEQYQWIMVDEYQDTNDAQLRLITSILRMSIDAPNLLVVGDDDQSIYKFQGANTRNIRILYDLYPDTNLILLTKNYRSYEEIIAFSRSIIHDHILDFRSIFPDKEKSFHSIRGKGGIVTAYEFSTELEEMSWVAHDIQTQIIKGVSPEDIAVITKKNHTLEMIAKLLLSMNIPVCLSKEENILEHEAIRLIINMILYIESLTKHTDRNDLLIDILSHPMWKIHRLTLWELSRKIAGAKKEENTLWIEVLRKHSDKNISKIAHFFIELSLLSRTTRLENIIDLLTGIESVDLGEDYDELGPREQRVMLLEGDDEPYVSPLYEYYFSPEKLEKTPTVYVRHLANIRKLIESIRGFRMNRQYLFLSDFHEYIQLIREYNISLHVSTLIGSEKAVQCITAHKAKGLEYAHVYAIGLTEKQYKRGKNVSNPLPVNLALSPEKDNEDDIRRLIYTVCTRAKDRLVLSHARLTLNEKSDTPVSVLSNIEKWIYIKPQTSVELAPVLLETESRDITSLPYTGPESEFLRNILHRNFQLSVTALQNFLDISRGGPKYFLANNVLRFPKSKHESAIYGTSMHKALEDFFRDYTARRVFQKDILFQSFSTSLKKEGLEPSRERDFLDRGETHLKKLYEYITGREYGELHLEYRFTEGGGVHIPLKAEQKASESNLPSSIRLTGAIDRIELTGDGTMIITDYKTGDSLDSLDIKGSHGDRIKAWRYRMQLVFYALLFSRTPRWNPWTHRVFQLFFIECNTKTNTFHEITEYIQTSEIERLEQLIQVVMKHIYTLNFPDVSQYDQTIEGIRQFEEDLLNGQI